MLATISRTAVASRAALRRVSTSPACAHALSSHIENEDNSVDARFEFSSESYAKIDKIVAKYPASYPEAAVIPVLDIAQRQFGGWLPISAMDKTAHVLNMPPGKVYEVASFYTMFNRTPVGKHFIEVCTNGPCMIGGCGSAVILEAAEKAIGVSAGHTTKDKEFTLVEVECQGACVNAPMARIGDDFYEDLTPETMTKLIDDLRAGKALTPGPQVEGRKCAEPIGGLTSLLGGQKVGGFAPRLDNFTHPLKEEGAAAAAKTVAEFEASKSK